jgi:hypothetical protein
MAVMQRARRQALTIVISLMISAQRLGRIAASRRMLRVQA